MTILGLFMFVVSISFFIFVVKLINHKVLTLEYALVWLAVSLVLLVFSLLPSVPDTLSQFFGFKVTSNFLLFVAVLFCLIQSIIFTSYFTKQSRYIKTLIQEVSLLKEKMEKEEQKK